MPTFNNAGVEIAYLDEGEGEPIILVHGFASTKDVNWVYPTWVSHLRQAGRRVIAFDHRGHGESAKLYSPEDYHIGTMAGDATALMDHLDIGRCDIMGYSLGGRITAFLARHRAERVKRAILGGENVAQALEAASLEDVTDKMGRTFRAFADQTRSDRRSLAACLRGSRRLMTREEAAAIAVPVLIAVGTKDDIAGSAQQLAAIIVDHMRAVGDKVYKEGVLAFLSRAA
jgi:pimeloyl-ACP methyl ester carboxylesterase